MPCSLAPTLLPTPHSLSHDHRLFALAWAGIVLGGLILPRFLHTRGWGERIAASPLYAGPATWGQALAGALTWPLASLVLLAGHTRAWTAVVRFLGRLGSLVEALPLS